MKTNPISATVMPFVTALALGLAVAGCRSPETTASGPVARDSAGVRIVENSGPSWPGGTGWTVADTPSVNIGGAGQGPEYEFSRIVGAVRLQDGRIAVANVGTSEVRLFDSAGQFLRASGRPGSGPGEYLMLGGLWSGGGDSLLVSDVRAQRLAVLDSAGTFVRHFSLGGRSGITVQAEGRISLAMPQAWLADGSVIGFEMPISVNEPREGTYRDTVTYIRFGPDGSTVDSVGRFPGPEMAQMTLSFGGQNFPSPSPVPLGRLTVVAARGTAVFVATNEAWQVEERSLDGKTIRLIRLAVQPMEVTSKDIETHRQEQLELFEGLPEMRAVPPALKTQMTDRLKTVKYPSTFPFIAALLTAADGTLWVQEVIRPGEERQQFAVFDSSGAFLGRVRLPARFQPQMIGTNEMIGIWKDPDDVEHVRVYPIRK